MTNLTLLALDTSTEACSVALLNKGEKTYLNELAQRTHTKRILPMIDEILANSGIRLNQVDALAFGRGPGSFTGVRVGAGIAQGLAFGADLPVIPISNLTAMAQAAFELHQRENVAAAIDARMNEVYFSQLKREKVRSDFGEFFQWREVITEQVCPPEQVIAQFTDESAFRVGTGWNAYLQFSEKRFTGTDIELPNALYMLELARVNWLQKEVISALDIEPIYLRNEVTWKKLPGRE
ncbi:tRNA (adenosine(37)-N6)-threonylcarbamoyltransferase complex dimerization subunit type 1 TsaB [Rodentibacter pneumotropicus]|uniref:tRNA (adenosine(37)-N6)-threonylcarbamoyltransferase complex dimerization subunit type 1 TsaB n=1 Tax=Rodentibacter pneumotropicus TaxID=758 RepID=UPI000362143A|nr:tRNA (adenosine(37)-N6)-threonylcarbamoyltransferase complex dimerization subunit type 1 TsaB [Rodentibacter pneumotropicus]NBH75663.1 tRNA (adenosine(37)-N6)-threonylcarbamoyltransferase complex dimerization subunit type 1 TsaB [Rodentibacter pneumotropicus]OOF60929.1 tRNA (adenosine(37)-N6)-threonylcarbamoyltransferase complex dimerization subunit type 1 TsaB [Rodentibacter pneumotropicus]THA01438.1 tRNA (adenosine(37)-N6)-threonylcarbamoyltransferase complex dimerization subunit type 1 Tsa